MTQPHFGQDYGTIDTTIKSMNDMGEKAEGLKKKLFNGLEDLNGGLKGGAGDAAQQFKLNINTHIETINRIADDIRDALMAAKTQTQDDDEAAKAELNKPMDQINPATAQLKSGL